MNQRQTVRQDARDGSVPDMQGHPAPLSFAQQRLWFLSQLRPDTSAYNLPQVFRLRGHLDLAALERALNEIRRRHEVLRTNFDTIDGQPVQIVETFQYMPLRMTDCTDLSEDERPIACGRLIDSIAQLPFNLKTDRLLRMAIIRLQSTEHVLVLVMHHIVFDGWSTTLLLEECATLYDTFLEGKPSPLGALPLQYSDYARAERLTLDFTTELAYWKEQLGGTLPVLVLPSDQPGAQPLTATAGRLTRVLPPELVQSLQRLGQRHQVTLFMTLLAALQTLLSRLSGQDDVIVGTPIAGRRQLETEQLLGLFLNTLPLRTDVSGNPTFVELLERVRLVVLNAIQYQTLPFEKLVEELQPQRSLDRTPLFRVMLNAFPIDAAISMNGLTVENLRALPDDAKFDLTWYVFKEQQDFVVRLVYHAELFDVRLMEEMFDQFFFLLDQIAVDPDRAVGSYSLVTSKARPSLPDPGSAITAPLTQPVTSQFLARAQDAPQHAAVVQSARSWTYQELSSSSSAVARTLLTRGLEPSDVVAISSDRNIGLVAGVLGVLMSGGVLLPIDRKLPAGRQRVMLCEARAKYLLYVGQARDEDEWLGSIPELEVINLSQLGDCQNGILESVSLPEISPDDPAYIFFTSGTTGVPKGVLGRHAGLSQFVAWQRDTFDIGPDDRCAQLTSPSFDVILRDIFLPLVSGATLCLPDAEAEVASHLTLAWIDRVGITSLHVVPSLAQAWLYSGPTTVPRKLRWAFFAGEPLTDVFVRKWRDATPPAARLVNLYGPTETTLTKCFYIVPDQPVHGIQPLGNPLPHAQALILNADTLCGVGEPGQIAIRTPFRTCGYINAVDEQRKRFVRNPFSDSPDDLIYWTGDRGRYGIDGTLEFLGRMDDQVKINGVRIEPAEITAVLAGHPHVSSCFVTARSDSSATTLVCYVVAGDKSATPREIRSYLAQHLPAVMVPAEFVFLDALPLTPNGKIDRKALVARASTHVEDRPVFTAPRTEIERTLAGIWSVLLNVDPLSIYDDFFDLGGHSLLATQAVSQARQAFRVEMPLRVIFSNPTIESLARFVVEQRCVISPLAEMEELLGELEALSDERAAQEALRLDLESPSKPSYDDNHS